MTGKTLTSPPFPTVMVWPSALSSFLNGVSAMVNGGCCANLPFLKKGSNDKDNYTRVISAGTSEKMRRLMHLLVQYGSGRRSHAQGYLVGGKNRLCQQAKKKVEWAMCPKQTPLYFYRGFSHH
ncbi:MAG: hypothetical protein H6925_05040 [Holosporaceae bacterium]|nr:MAG: hypothetical protein H6925_05040 [Holosporaceae bacterium]